MLQSNKEQRWRQRVSTRVSKLADPPTASSRHPAPSNPYLSHCGLALSLARGCIFLSHRNEYALPGGGYLYNSTTCRMPWARSCGPTHLMITIFPGTSSIPKNLIAIIGGTRLSIWSQFFGSIISCLDWILVLAYASTNAMWIECADPFLSAEPSPPPRRTHNIAPNWGWKDFN